MKAGSHHTLEARTKMSKSRMGISTAGRKRKPLSSEHKKHLSEANKGKLPSAEHRKHLSEALRGRKRTPEQIAKLSEAHMPGTIYQSYQVRTNKGIAIFTNEDDAREFSRIKQLDSTLDRLQLDKIMAERIKEEKG